MTLGFCLEAISEGSIGRGNPSRLWCLLTHRDRGQSSGRLEFVEQIFSQEERAMQFSTSPRNVQWNVLESLVEYEAGGV